MLTPDILLRDLIALPSVNPAFAGGNHAVIGERRVADYLAALAAQAGLSVEFQPVLPDRPNLIVRCHPGSKPTHRVLLAPHLDTVGAPEITPILFDPVRKAGRLHGRGACDTKGSVAAMFCALLATLASTSRPRKTEIVFAGLADEENGQAGSRALAASGLKADLAIVGEPTCLKVVTAHKGDVWLRLQTAGRSAHGATPHLGRNAVHAMARVVDALETDYAQDLKRRHHPLLGSPTINVGVIRGGTQPNVVPDQCQIDIDRRTLPGETESGVRREILSLLRARKLRATFRGLRSAPCPALQTDPRLPWVRSLLDQLGQKEPLGVDYFCDAAVLAGGGIPSVVFGPGDIAQAHTADEWISLRSLETATRLLTRWLLALP